MGPAAIGEMRNLSGTLGRLLVLQGLLTAVVVCATWYWKGVAAATAALLGGAVNGAGTLAFALVIWSIASRDAKKALRATVLAEAARVFSIVLLLGLGFGWVDVALAVFFLLGFALVLVCSYGLLLFWR
jgi:F0F1-type ATP synthase assembly protein I